MKKLVCGLLAGAVLMAAAGCSGLPTTSEETSAEASVSTEATETPDAFDSENYKKLVAECTEDVYANIIVLGNLSKEL